MTVTPLSLVVRTVQNFCTRTIDSRFVQVPKIFKFFRRQNMIWKDSAKAKDTNSINRANLTSKFGTLAEMSDQLFKDRHFFCSLLFVPCKMEHRYFEPVSGKIFFTP